MSDPVAGSFQYVWFGGVRNDLLFTPAAGDFGRPAIADFDGDGDGEILLSQANLEEAIISLNGYIDADGLRPSIDGDGNLVGDTLTIPLILPNIPGTTEVQVLGWEMRSRATQNGPLISMMPRGSHLESFPIGTTVSVSVEGSRSASDMPTYTTHEGYVFLIRLVDTSGATPVYYPALRAAYVNPNGSWVIPFDNGPRTVTPLEVNPPPPPAPPTQTPTPGSGESGGEG